MVFSLRLVLAILSVILRGNHAQLCHAVNTRNETSVRAWTIKICPYICVGADSYIKSTGLCEVYSANTTSMSSAAGRSFPTAAAATV